MKSRPHLLRRLLAHPLELALALVVALTPLGGAFANPQGGQVVGGQATIQGQGTKTVTVNQSSQNAIINWNTFNIGAGELTQFNQPNSSSITLNRVTGNLGPSQIYGTITANGRVFLVNPDGILFGLGSRIDAAGFLASTNDIRNRAFMHGHYHFNIPGRLDASIVNLGRINATNGGFAALVAPGVRNAGVITADLGHVALASGNSFTLDFYGDKLITLQVDHGVANQVIDVATGQPLTTLVENDGKLRANGGTVSLTAAAARTVVDSVINNTGVIEANSVGTKDGMIVLGAATEANKPQNAPTQNVVVSGTISARGTHANQTGGTVVITGERIALQGAKINASGTAGGGTVLIGGDTGGGHLSAAVASIPQAQLQRWPVAIASMVTIDQASVIKASATRNGNGGKVVVWSSGLTSVAGLIAASGGPFGGNGGFVETSGQTVNFDGIRVNTSAPNGTAGLWLIDPMNLIVDANAAATISANLETTSVLLQTSEEGSPTGPGNAVAGAGDIIINSGIAWSSGNTLTLSAYNGITVNAPIDIQGAGGLNMTAANTPGLANVALISFGTGGSVQFTGTPNSGQSLIINGQSYTLLYNMSDVQGINANGKSLQGLYALAKPIDASGVTGWVPLGTDINGTVLNEGSGFVGTFQGLGNVISGFRINSENQYVGLFGYVGTGGLIANLGVTNASVQTQGNSQFVGILSGGNLGTIVNSYTSGVAGNASGDTPPDTVMGAYGGLVGNNGFGATISQSYSTANVKVQGPANAGWVDGGGLVGQNHGTISASYATGAVNGVNLSAEGSFIGGLVGWNTDGQISQSYATGSVSGSGAYVDVGGLVGTNVASITASYATGNVSATGNIASYIAGGLVGMNSGGISLSYATGSVNGLSDAGGLVGMNYGTISQSYSTGAVSGSSYVGGLVGWNLNDGSISASFWDTSTNAPGLQGVGNQSEAPGVTGLTTAQFGNITYFQNAGWAFGTTPGGAGCSDGGACWVIVDNDGSLNNASGTGATRPMLLSEWSSTITNAHQLQLVALNTKANYTLANDIDLGTPLANASDVWGPNGNAGFVPIGQSGNGFTGVFDGQGHVISGLTIAPTYSGFFAAIGLFGINSGTIQNVSLTNVSITADPNIASRSDFGTLPGSQYVGAIAGVNNGLIDTVSASGQIDGRLVGGASLGGLVGYNNSLFTYDHDAGLLMIGTIQNSSSAVIVTAGGHQFCEFQSCINVANLAGGLAGFNGGNIIGSFATGNVASISSSGGAEIGGLVGANSGTITGAYAIGSVSSSGSNSYAGGLVGLNLDGQGAGGGFYISMNGSSIAQSWAGGAVTVTGPGSIAGGLVGGNGYLATIDQSYAVGPVTIGTSSLAGGLVGVNGGSITQTYATGPVTGGTGSILGGLVAVNNVTSQNSDSSTMISGTVASSYWDVATTGQLHSAGSADNFGLTTAQFGNIKNFAGWTFGATPGGSGWVIIDADGSLNNASNAPGATRPILLSEWSTTITNPHQLELINLDLSANYRLANNIGLEAPLSNPSRVFAPNGAAGFVPIGSIGDPFSGTFNGQGYTISGLVIAPVDKQVNSIGLFGANTGIITNLNLADVAITANPNVGLPGQFVGTLTGQNFGFIGNVTASGAINGLDLAGVTAGGLVGQNGSLGSNFTGGIGVAGLISGDLMGVPVRSILGQSDVFVFDKVQTARIVRSHADVSVTLGDGVVCNSGPCNGGFNNAGGLVGFNVATIAHSSASGAVAVGANTFAGGLVGTNQNTNFDGDGPPVALAGPRIIDSWASGAVSSSSGGVALGGLVGYNAPLAVVWNSHASGNVTSGATATGDCSPDCPFANAGGLVGQNFGEIFGWKLPSADHGCTAGFSCASGVVTVGAGSIGGGLVGENQGIIRNAFATGNVVGAAGVNSSGDFDQTTTLGGLVGANEGVITRTFAIGAVGGVNVANLDVGGLVGDNGGVVWRSAAFGPVAAGANSLAGGIAGDNNIPHDSPCGTCSVGDGFNQRALIAHSTSRGSVTVDANSVAGGITAINSGTLRGDHSGSAVSGGHDSVIAGLAGINDLTGLIKYSFEWGLVTSTGPNSVAAGLIGINGGEVRNSDSRAAVSGVDNSYVGGLAGINIGTIKDSHVVGDAAVVVSGTGNIVGGFVGANMGMIDPSTTDVIPQAGAGNIVGSFAGANLTFSPSIFNGLTVPPPSFPAGTISSDSQNTNTATVPTPPPFTGTATTLNNPGTPTVFNSCRDAICQIFQTGFMSPSQSPPPPQQPTDTTSPIDTPPPPQQVIAPANNNNTTQPTLVNLTSTPDTGTGTGNNNGNHNNNAGPPQSPGPPPGPGLGRTYDEQHFSGVPPIGETRFLRGEIVVQISNTVPLSTVQKIAQQLGITLISSQTYDVNGRVIYRFSAANGKDIRLLIRALEKNQIVASAQPNYVFNLSQSAPAPAAEPPPEQTDSIPPKAPPVDQPGLANADTASLETLPAGDAAQYVIDKMHLAQIHNMARGRNVVVAVIDSEIDANHPDLKGDIIERFDATQTPSHPHLHGTGMAGAIAAHQRLLGVAPGVKLLAIKAFDEQASSAEATSVQILKGLEYAMAHKARVINMSFAGPHDPMLERTLKLAHDKGIILVAAAGNAGPKSPPLYPGADPNVIAVTASDYNDRPFTMANRGKYIAVAAPGVDVMVPAPGNTYQLTTGTSVASAHVSGVAALLVERKPDITPDEVRAILMRTAIPYSARPKGEEDGAGLVDPVAALKALGPSQAAQVVPRPSAPAMH